MNKYPFMLSINYVADWGIVDGVRELLQNAIDSPDPFEYQWHYNESTMSHTLILHSRTTVLPAHTLLLGNTDKQRDAIGGFGEGYKLALLVLKRAGCRVHMVNGDVVWRPHFELNETLASHMFCIHEDDLSTVPEDLMTHRDHSGLIVTVEGLSSVDKDRIIQSCILLNTDHEKFSDVVETSLGNIYPRAAGEVYVNGLFVCNTSMHCGYDIKPRYIQLERDRKTVHSWDLGITIAKMWVQHPDPMVVVRHMYNKIPDMQHIDLYMNDSIRDAIKKHYREKHPNSYPVASDTSLSAAQDRGHKATLVPSNVATVLQSEPDLRVPEEHVKTPADLVSEWRQRYWHLFNDDIIAAVAELHEMSKRWN